MTDRRLNIAVQLVLSRYERIEPIAVISITVGVSDQQEPTEITEMIASTINIHALLTRISTGN